MFCSVSLAFSDTNSVFCKGFSDWRCVHQRLKEHENSASHVSSVNAYIRKMAEKSIEYLINKEQLLKHKQVLERRSIFF